MDFDSKNEEQVKQRMKSLVQELKKEEEAEQREKATKQPDLNGDTLKKPLKPRKARKCNVSLNKPISLNEDSDEEEESEDEQELKATNNKAKTNGNYYAKNSLSNEHDYYTVANGDKESEQIIEINGEIIKGAQIVYVDDKELNENGEQVFIVQNGGELVETELVN